MAEVLFGTGLSCGEQSQNTEGNQPQEVFVTQPAALGRDGCCHQSNKTRGRGGGSRAGMLVCLLGIEEGTAGCSFTAQRVQQLFPNKKPHPKNKLSAPLPHCEEEEQRSQENSSFVGTGDVCSMLSVRNDGSQVGEAPGRAVRPWPGAGRGSSAQSWQWPRPG